MPNVEAAAAKVVEAAPRPRQSRQYRPLPASARTSTTNSDPELSASNITASQKP